MKGPLSGPFLYRKVVREMHVGTTVAEIRKMLASASADEFAAIERSLEADTRKGVQSALESARRRIQAETAERERLRALYSFDRAQVGQSGVVVGLDEVGRGAVAGPLAVGAVVLPVEYRIPLLNDSKKLTSSQRVEVADAVKEQALAWTVYYVEPETIDRDGMSSSLRRAFSGALSQIEDAGVRCDVVLVDGNPLGIDDREKNVVKGDSKSASIAAASVVAKVERDELMKALSGHYPVYGFAENKGYAAQQHIEAIRAYGLCAAHRKSFCKSFLQETLF